MCGITGIVNANTQTPVSREKLKAMSGAISHRGPDAEGFFVNQSGVGLAHRRLSIIDLSGGDQPIGNEDGSIQIVFNGEIYNHRELRSSLKQRGHQFRTKSDTESIVHLYEDYGSDVVTHLRGMFAFALWDSRKQQLLLARDRLGQKPLYYSFSQNRLLFGSEIKSILAAENQSREIDLQALENYLYFGFIPGEQSIFKDIRKLKAGSTLTLEVPDWNLTEERYWSLPSADSIPRATGEWKDQVLSKIKESVDAHLIADVPVGSFLSGGLDSSLITAFCSELSPETTKTFSIGFEKREFSELEHAAVVAQAFNTEHTEEIVTADAVQSLENLVHYYDEPFADPSAIPTMRVAEIASQQVKVVLSGDGGDEAFGGYSRYSHDLWEDRIRNIFPSLIKKSIFGPLAQLYPKADWAPRPLRLKTALHNLSQDAAHAYANTLCQCPEPFRRRLLRNQVWEQLSDHHPENRIIDAFGDHHGDPLKGMLAVDTSILLPDDFLTKVDRASMAVGLEVRPPLVDHELIELAWQIPSDLKVRNGETKWIMKQVAGEKLPHDIIHRKKQGFELPIDHWLRGPLKQSFEEHVLSEQTPLSNYFDTSYIRKLYQSHCNGTGRHGGLLWSILVLAYWMNRYLKA